MDRFVLITGASSGIGENACRVLSEAGYAILASVRRQKDGDRLIRRYGSRIYPLLLDVTDPASIDSAVEAARSRLTLQPLVAIINNAGVAVNGPVLHVPAEAWQQQFDINVTGAVRVTQAFFPFLLQHGGRKADRHPRRIINMSSVSGRFASPFLGPYAASKYALEALSDSLRRELYMHDIQVVLIQPGTLRTPIWDKARTGPVYSGPDYDDLLANRDRILDLTIAEALPVEVLDKVILQAVRSPSPRIRYLIRRKALVFRMLMLLPTRFIDKLIARKLRKRTGFRP